MAITGDNPDLSYSVLQLAKKNNSATIADLRNVNKVVKKVKKWKIRWCIVKLEKKRNCS